VLVFSPERSKLAHVIGRRVRRLASAAGGAWALIGIAMVAAIVVSIAVAPGSFGYFGAGLAFIMLAIAVVDGRSFIIPDGLNAAAFVLALAYAAAQEPDAVWRSVALATVRGTTLGLIFLTLYGLYIWLRGREGIGLGDVKLAGVAGAWLDWTIIPIAVQIAALAALAVYLLRQFALRRPMSATARLPFGLFFAPAIWAGWVLEMWLVRF
jgi:leader peptidase (prepilin peptidase)/N-methyltransferase